MLIACLLLLSHRPFLARLFVGLPGLLSCPLAWLLPWLLAVWTFGRLVLCPDPSSVLLPEDRNMQHAHGNGELEHELGHEHKHGWEVDVELEL